MHVCVLLYIFIYVYLYIYICAGVGSLQRQHAQLGTRDPLVRSIYIYNCIPLSAESYHITLYVHIYNYIYVYVCICLLCSKPIPAEMEVVAGRVVVKKCDLNRMRARPTPYSYFAKIVSTYLSIINEVLIEVYNMMSI